MKEQQKTRHTLYEQSTYHLLLKLSQLFFIISVIIILLDLYESYISHYFTMVYMETALVSVELSAYLLYHWRFISVQTFASFLIIPVSLLVAASQFIIGQNPEFSLFALAILPIFIYFFLGLKKGTLFTFFLVLILTLAVINSYLEWIEPLIFTPSLHLQVLVAYIGISFLYYKFEEDRQGFENQLVTFNTSQKVLHKELNHRVKNNLQMIIGLLLMQSRRVKNQECQKALSSQVNRLKAIGMVHEQLTSNQEATSVAMDVYLTDMINSLSLLTEHTVILNVEKLILDNKTATYVGLFVNEAVCNAIEHAYLPDTHGEIHVSLILEDDAYVLTVEDFGQGFNGQESTDSLGLLLMENISDFLENSFMLLDFENGTKITLEFSREQDYDTALESQLL